MASSINSWSCSYSNWLEWDW